jgi:hypothetical protein
VVEIKDLGQETDHSLIYHHGNDQGGSMVPEVVGTFISKTQTLLLIKFRHSPTNSFQVSIIALTVMPESLLIQTTALSAEKKLVNKFHGSK